MSKKEPPGTLSKDDSKPFLEPLVPALLESFWEAWEWTNGWVASDEKARMILHSSSMAGIVSDAFGHFCRPRLVSFNPRWTTKGRFYRAVIGSRVALRFKKLTPDLLSSNVRTESQRQVYQQDQALLPGTLPITSITLGYALEKVTSKVTGIYFTCPADFDKNAWSWPIFQAGDGQLSLFEGTPLPPSDKVEDVLNVDIKVPRRKAE